LQVINAYIYLTRAEKHLLCREKSKIRLEKTLILHRDGQNKDKSIPNVKEDPIVERVKKYVAHDMVIIIYFSTYTCLLFSLCHLIYNSIWHPQVFVPINIKKYHWYLAVINAKKRRIQVLDSMGLMCRGDLTFAVSINL
jgi:hypothetical protein